MRDSPEERERKRILEMLKGTLFPCVRAKVTFDRKNADIYEWKPLGRSNASRGYNGKLVYLPLAEQLGVGLLYDQGDTFAHVRDVELGQWNLTIKAAMDVAVTNLKKISPPDFRRIEDGINLFVAAWSDEHTSARLLVPEIFAGSPGGIKGPLVVIAPSADRILLCDAFDISAMMLMFEIAASLWQAPRPIPMLPLLFRSGTWDILKLPPDHPCYYDLKLFSLAALNLMYQQESERIAIETNDSVFSPSLELVQDFDEGRLYTKVIVPEGRRSILPLAEYIEFFREGAEGQYESLAVVSLNRARAGLGARMEVDENFPPRIILHSFPDKKQLSELGFEKPSTLPVYVPPPEAAIKNDAETEEELEEQENDDSKEAVGEKASAENVSELNDEASLKPVIDQTVNQATASAIDIALDQVPQEEAKEISDSV